MKGIKPSSTLEIKSLLHYTLLLVKKIINGIKTGIFWMDMCTRPQQAKQNPNKIYGN